VLTHTVPTAYDKQGRCCKFKGAEPPKPDEEDVLRASSLLLSKEQVDGFMTNLKTVMAGGNVSMQDIVRSRVGNLTSKLEDEPRLTGVISL